MDQKDTLADFLALMKYYRVVYIAAKEGKVLPAERLNKIRDHIRHCDFLVDVFLDKALLYGTYICWRICVDNWTRSTPRNEMHLKIEPLDLKTPKLRNKVAGNSRTSKPRTFEESIGPKGSPDRKFLRSLRIARDDESPA